MKKFSIAIAGGGSTFTPGIILMLLENLDRFPVKEVKLYDNDEERQATIAGARRVMLKAKAQRRRLAQTTASPTAHRWAAVITAHVRVWNDAMRGQHATTPFNAGAAAPHARRPGGSRYGMRTIGAAIEPVGYAETHW